VTDGTEVRKSAPLVPRELRLMWVSLMRGTWNSIAIVPVFPGHSCRPVAAALSDLTRFHDVAPFLVLDAEGAEAGEGERLAQELRVSVQKGLRVVVVVESVLQSLAAIRLALAVDAVLLVVRLGQSDFASTQSTVEIVGRDRVLGCVTIGSRPSQANREPHQRQS